MLLRKLLRLLYSGVVVKPTAHEIASITVILAPPSILDRPVDSLVFHKVIVTLSAYKIAVPLLQLPKVVPEQLLKQWLC